MKGLRPLEQQKRQATGKQYSTEIPYSRRSSCDSLRQLAITRGRAAAGSRSLANSPATTARPGASASACATAARIRGWRSSFSAASRSSAAAPPPRPREKVMSEELCVLIAGLHGGIVVYLQGLQMASGGRCWMANGDLKLRSPFIA
nr:hypothetical protein Iba_chr11aCG6740 [Ipomoea batatas]